MCIYLGAGGRPHQRERVKKSERKANNILAFKHGATAKEQPTTPDYCRFEWEWPPYVPMFGYLDPVDGTVWEGFRGVALLEVGFEGSKDSSYSQHTFSLSSPIPHLHLLLVGQDVSSQLFLPPMPLLHYHGLYPCKTGSLIKRFLL